MSMSKTTFRARSKTKLKTTSRITSRSVVFALVVLTAATLGFVIGVVALRARRGSVDAFTGRIPAVVPVPASTATPAPLASGAPAVPVAAGPGVNPRPPHAAPAAARTDAGNSAVTEAALMERLRGLEGTDPPLTLRLAREGNARFPDSADAPERAWMAVKSLVNMQRFSEARDEAQTMVNRYPGTSWSQDVQRHLLSNPLQ